MYAIPVMCANLKISAEQSMVYQNYPASVQTVKSAYKSMICIKDIPGKGREKM